MSSTTNRPSHLALYEATKTDALFPDAGADNERVRMVALASQLLPFLAKHGLLTPENLDDFDDERPSIAETIEFKNENLKIRDTLGGDPAIYSTLLINQQTYLLRNGRVFCQAAEESKVAVLGESPARTEDYAALDLGLRALLEVAKYPATIAREKAANA